MKQQDNTQKIVITLDAGGTNFVFGAMCDGKPIGQSLTLIHFQILVQNLCCIQISVVSLTACHTEFASHTATGLR